MSEGSEMLTRLVGKQDEARKAKESLHEKRSAIVQLAKDDGREDLEETEDTEFRSHTDAIRELDDEIEKRDVRIAELVEEEKRSGNASLAFKRAALVDSQVRVNSEARTYEKGNRQSYFRDLALATVNQDFEARARLERHGQEMTVERRTNPNRTDGQGGYFVPPLWLMDEYSEYLRAGRTTANLVTNMALPGGTDSINIPKVATGTATAAQTADAQAVQSTDLTDSSVAVPVRTIAGQQDVAIQLLEQSPLNFDEIVFRDLIADLNQKLDVQVLSGSGASGQVLGILTVTNGITTTSYIGTTVQALYSKIAGGVNSVHTSRFMPPTAIVVHPRRWAYLLAAVDGNQRPLITPVAPQNAMGGFGGVESEGLVGSLQGINVYVDANVPSNVGTSTNEDRIIILRATDPILWEGELNSRVLPDVLSNTLQVRLQVYKYLAFTAERYPQSISVLQGTGLTTPSF